MHDPNYLKSYLFIKVRSSPSDAYYPLGSILERSGDEDAYNFWANTDPDVWRPFEHGALVNPVAYPELAKLLTDIYGEARLPDFRGRVFVPPSLAWSRHTAGERELQRDRSREAKKPPVVWTSEAA